MTKVSNIQILNVQLQNYNKTLELHHSASLLDFIYVRQLTLPPATLHLWFAQPFSPTNQPDRQPASQLIVISVGWLQTSGSGCSNVLSQNFKWIASVCRNIFHEVSLGRPQSRIFTNSWMEMWFRLSSAGWQNSNDEWRLSLSFICVSVGVGQRNKRKYGYCFG